MTTAGDCSEMGRSRAWLQIRWSLARLQRLRCMLSFWLFPAEQGNWKPPQAWVHFGPDKRRDEVKAGRSESER
jgi:hypothetical protein